MTETGIQYPVDVPADMKVRVLVSQLVRELSPSTNPQLHADVWESLYELHLFVKRHNTLREVPDEYTIREANLKDGDICRLRGHIREPIQDFCAP